MEDPDDGAFSFLGDLFCGEAGAGGERHDEGCYSF